jgi:septal ring factor EnvC (AmiA/AmiB activator)
MTSFSRHFLLLLLGILLLATASPVAVVAQKSSMKKRQNELQNLRSEIERYEKRIKESSKQERSALQRIDDYDRQTSLIRRLLSRLSEEINENQKEIAIARLNLATAEKELRRLKREYSRTIVSMYKRGRTHDTELLLSAGSVNEMFIRSKYLKAYSERQRGNAQEIRRRKRKIELQQMQLEERIREQRAAINEKRVEESALGRKVSEHKNLLTKVRQDKQSYEEQLRRKQAAARKMERMIADLIERERKRVEAERSKLAKKSGKAPPASLPSKPISNTRFGKLQGRLPWPVAQGAVVGFFGTHTNPRNGLLSQNIGIDISTPNGSPVKSIADGTVSMVNYLIGYGNLIIVHHDDGFRSVYANLSETAVREKQRVKAGQTIGKSGEGDVGPILHLELWYGKSKLNPLDWLTRR